MFVRDHLGEQHVGVHLHPRRGADVHVQVHGLDVAPFELVEDALLELP